MTTAGRSPHWFPWLVVLGTSIVIGFFAWYTYVAPVPPLYPLVFNQGQWLIATDESPQGYFRREFYIPTPVQQAWFAVAGTDSFILYVNGKAVDANAYASLNVSGIYDIGPYLRPGKNVIGVLVRRKSYPGAAMAVAEGGYVDETGQEHLIATDAAWKFSAVERRQGNGDIPWHAPLFSDLSWSQAQTAGYPRLSEIYPLSVHPLALTLPPQGKWVGQVNSQPSRATFAQTFTLPSRPEEAWLRIAANGPYLLVINGVTVTSEEASRDASGMRLVLLQGDPIWTNLTGSSTDLYRITPLLQSGANHLAVTVERQSAAVAGLFIDGFLSNHGETLTFGSDGSWLDPVAFQMTNGQRVAQSSMVLLGDHDSVGRPLPLKRLMQALLPTSHAVKQGGELVILVSIMVVLTFSVWRGASRLLQHLSGGDAAACSRAAALTYLPPLVFLGGILLLSFDVRFDPTLPYQGWVISLAVVTLVLGNGLIILEAWWCKPWKAPSAGFFSVGTHPLADPFGAVVLLGLIIAGAFLRFQGLDAQSLYHDEVHMISFVKGLLQKGYPYKMIGPIEIPLSTYELVPYPIALSALLLGFNDTALRLPAALFGIMTIPLMYLIGARVFNSRVGLMAAAIYAVCPQALVWAKYLWHPQQVQFFALLSSYFFYRAIRPAPLSPKYLYLAAISFIITYLSWEGAGFLLPALAIGLLVVKGKDVSWLRDKHLWIASGVVAIAIIIQLGRRILLQVPYLVVGTGLSDVSLPSPFFLDAMYDPIFYVKNFLWLENNVILTLLLIAGVPFLCKQAGQSYYAALLLAILWMMTNLMSRATIRYVYYVQPFLILVACAVTWAGLDRMLQLAHDSCLRVLWLLNRGTVLGVVAIVLLGSSVFLKLYRLNDFAYPAGFYTRPNSYYCDYRSSAQYVRAHYKSGDLIIVVMPEVLRYYADLPGDYFVQDYTKRQVLFDPVGESSRYLERMSGTAVVRGPEELRGIINRYRRTWIVAAPYSIFYFISGAETVDHINKHGKLLHESYDSRIYLLES